MSVVQSLEETGPCRRKLDIAVPKAAVDAETDRVLQQYRKNARLSGFRKGKAPRELVRRQFASEIRQEVLDRLVPRYWKQAEAEKEIQPLLAPQVESVDFDLGGDLKFVAVVEVRPDITLGDVENFEFPVVATEPKDEEVEAEMTALRRRFGEWKEVDRAAAQGDLVKVHVRKGEAEDEDPLTFEVGEERIWEELSLAVSGLKAGQQSTFDRSEGEEGESVSYAVRLEKVEEKELPDLTDDWVQEFTELKSVDELRERLTEGMKSRLGEAARRTRRESLLHQLRERHPFSVPEGVVMDEIESMLRHYAQNLARQGVDVEKVELDWPELAERFRPQAERTVQADLILDAVATEQKIEVPAEKLEAALAQIAAARQTSTLAVRRALASEGRLEQLQRQLRRDEVVSRLLGEEPEGAVDESGEADPDEADAAPEKG